MMLRRFGRPGLLGTMARTAVVAGTATAVVGGMQNHQQARAQAAQDQQYAQQSAAQSQQDIAEMQNELATMQARQAAPASAAGGDTIAELEKLGQLKQSGLLTDAEFAAAKAKLLGT